jgi:PAS domain S-box-containing protein
VSWQKYMLEHGYLGVVVLPLRNEQQTFGLLALYSANTLHISDNETSLLQEVADNLAYGLVNIQKQQDSARVLSVVNKIAESVALSTGAEFLEKLVLNMTEAVGAQIGIITRLQSHDADIARTVAVVIDGKVCENFDIPMKGTPCEHISTLTGELIVSENLLELYPHAEGLVALGAQAYVGRRIQGSLGQAMGKMFVLFRQPLVNPNFVSSVLKIFTARVAGELERQEKQELINEQASWLDKAHHVITVRSIEKNIRFWNKSAEKLYGWTKEEVMGRSIVDVLYDDPTEFDAAMEKVMSLGEWSGEISQRRKDGRQLIVEAHWSLVRDDDGQPKSVFSISQDITQRRL